MVSTFGVVPEEGKHYPVEEPVVSTVVNLPLFMQVSAKCLIHCVGLVYFSVKGLLGALVNLHM